MRLSGSHLSQHGIINSTQENRHHMHSQHDKLNPESSHSNLFNVPSQSQSLLKKRPRIGMTHSGRRSGGKVGRGPCSQPKIFRCPLESCGKIFHDRASLKKHNTVHGDKLFQCTHEGCGKRFLDNAKLKRHMLVHTVSIVIPFFYTHFTSIQGEKPYKCELCNKRFSLDFNLKTHMRIHTGEKPFICPFQGCNKRFNQKSNLHAHQLTHHLEGGTLNPSSLLLNQLTSANGQTLDQLNAIMGCF